jgi:hypothetical protein
MLQSSTMFKIFDTVFVTAFAVEIMLKWYANFFGYWRLGWNVFDFILVASSIFAPGIESYFTAM